MNPTQAVTRITAALCFGCALGAALALATADSSRSAEVRSRVYLFRGFAGVIFSRGTDQLAQRIEKAGFAATVNEAVMCSSIAQEAIRDYRRDPAPIAVIGHSLGAACALSFAETLQSENIPVALVVTTDPARIAHDVPPNVRRYINIFQSSSLLGGRDVAPAHGFHGHFASYDLVEHTDITHNNMEKLESIHEQVVTKIRQLAAGPTTAAGEAVPIRVVVPADAEIELWDSGMPVSTQAGDTLPRLATAYHVPLWSLVQINGMSNDASLAPGQRVIVPRHLAPPAASNSDAVTGQVPLQR